MPKPMLLPPLRADIPESADLLRLSRAGLYERIHSGEITAQHDGRRRYISRAELQRYVRSLDKPSAKRPAKTQGRPRKSASTATA
jgi:excisionase family DNA binding protein